MLINELSKRTGVSIHTLRFYENYGLFNGLSDENVKTNNYKDYAESLIETIATIIAAKEVGFTLSEIKALLDTWYSTQFTMEKKVEVVNNKVREIEKKIKDLQKVKKILLAALKDIQNGDC